MEKIIELSPLAEIGKGRAKITDDSVEIEVSGINGGMKAWLIGKEAQEVGNIVNGRLNRRIDTRNHYGLLVTQSGRQMLIGKYREEIIEDKTYSDTDSIEEKTDVPEKTPMEIEGIEWKKIQSPCFDKLCRELKFIVSNKNVYANYKKHGYYYVGENDGSAALALACDAEESPLDFLSRRSLKKDGYAIICVDKNSKRLYSPKDSN